MGNSSAMANAARIRLAMVVAACACAATVAVVLLSATPTGAAQPAAPPGQDGGEPAGSCSLAAPAAALRL